MAAAPVERFLIGGTLDLASLGIWSAVRQLQSLPQVFLQVIITVVAPMFVGASAKGQTDEVTHLYRIATDWIGRMGFPLLIFLAVFGEKVLGLYGTAFSDAGYWPLMVLVVGQFVNLATGPVGAALNMLGQEKPMLRIGLISDGLFFVCLLTLAPWLGLLGAAIAGAMANIYVNLAALRHMRRELGIAWWSARYRRLLAPLLSCLLLAFLVGHAGVAHGAWRLAAALAATYSVFFLTYLLRGLSPEDQAIYCKVRDRFGFASEKAH